MSNNSNVMTLFWLLYGEIVSRQAQLLVCYPAIIPGQLLAPYKYTLFVSLAGQQNGITDPRMRKSRSNSLGAICNTQEVKSPKLPCCLSTPGNIIQDAFAILIAWVL